MTLTEKQIAKLESKGFKRWTKGDYDRLYINAYNIHGIDTNWKKNGKKTLSINGEELSYTKSAELSYMKIYIDVKTGEVVADWDNVKALVEAELSEVIETLDDNENTVNEGVKEAIQNYIGNNYDICKIIENEMSYDVEVINKKTNSYEYLAGIKKTALIILENIVTEEEKTETENNVNNEVMESIKTLMTNHNYNMYKILGNYKDCFAVAIINKTYDGKGIGALINKETGEIKNWKENAQTKEQYEKLLNT